MRYRLPDTLRGALLLSMIAYHTGWDLVYLFGYRVPWFTASPGYVWQQSICWGFILLSGFCLGLGPLQEDKILPGPAGEVSVFAVYKRGLTVFAAGLLVTGATLAVLPENPVIFGILFFLGSAMLLTVRLRGLWLKIPARPGLAASLTAFFLLRNSNEGEIGFEGLVLGKMPVTLYDQGMPGAFLGFPGRDFVSSDYFSLIPWYFLFLTGFFFCRLLLPQKRERLWQRGTPGLAWLGRRSLGVYLLHQPVILSILYVLLR